MGFSFASVILSYFLVAGGTFFTWLLAAKLGVHGEYVGYLLMAIGAFLGGVIAARASRGSTIVEPAIGAGVVVVSLVALGFAVAGKETREVILLPTTMKPIILMALASAFGGIAGASLSEKVFGESTTSSVPWLLYISLAGFGAALLGTIFGGVLGKGEDAGGVVVGAIALCTLLVGLSSGASARTRTLGASFLGGAIGVGGFFALAGALSGLFSAANKSEQSDAYAGMAVIAIGAGLLALIASLIGWVTVGRKHAG